MIAIDTNVLIYAFRADSPRHAAAQSVLSELIGSDRRVAIPWPCVHEFLAVTTNPRMPNPAPVASAAAAVQTLLTTPRVEAIGEGEQHLELLTGLLTQSLVRGPQVHDARIAAICLAHGVDELWTADRDFSAFSPLRTRNPLAAG